MHRLRNFQIPTTIVTRPLMAPITSNANITSAEEDLRDLDAEDAGWIGAVVGAVVGSVVGGFSAELLPPPLKVQ